LKEAKAFAPAAISSFFEIRDTDKGKPITDVERLGAIGGGFGLTSGVHTKVTAKKAQKNTLNIRINGQKLNAKTTKQVIKNLLQKTDAKYEVTVEHQIDIPIGMGFGTSAGGALTTGLALSKAIELPLTYNQIGAIAHAAEIHCQTGLGTVSSLTFSGGLVLVLEPGAPGFCKIDRIPISPDYMVVVGFYKSRIPKKMLFTSPEKKREINGYGKKALDSIQSEPSLENFLEQCWEFSQNAGFASHNTRQLVAAAKKAGAVGAAQNMIGEAIHAVVHEENADSVAEAFKQTLPSNQVLVSRIDFQGARLTI
jgi:pantoate kinase